MWRATSACVDVKKKFQYLEEKVFGMSVRTKAGGKQHAHTDHYEIEVLFDNQAKGQSKTYILMQNPPSCGGISVGGGCCSIPLSHKKQSIDDDLPFIDALRSSTSSKSGGRVMLDE